MLEQNSSLNREYPSTARSMSATLARKVIPFPPKQMTDVNQTQRGRVAVFVDGSNLFYAARKIGVRIDYLKLLNYTLATSTLHGAFFYTSINSRKANEVRFVDRLARTGYQVITKELIQRSDGSRKANLDVEMTLNIVEMSFRNLYDTAILISGDGDFVSAVDWLHCQGRRVEIIGLECRTSEALIQVADQFTDLAGIRAQITS